MMIRFTMSWVALAGFLAVAGAANASVVPNAVYQAGAGLVATLSPNSQANVATDTTVPSSESYSGTFGQYNAMTTASAETVGMSVITGSPTVYAQGSVTGSLGGGAGVGAAARITYFLEADPIPGAPSRSVPIILHAAGGASCDYVQDGYTELASSGVWLGANMTQWCYVTQSTAEHSFSETTTVNVASGTPFQVLIQASGQGATFTGTDPETWSFSAWCDPSATIDPNWAYASQYTLSVSQNVLTPEPATLSLLAFGGLALLRRRKK
jgi:hypothetical protein